MNISIKYPEQKPQMRLWRGKEEIYCPIRRKWLIVQPEEWVRQNFILYLNLVLKYPITLIAVEKKLLVGEMMKRFDIVIYNNEVKPWMVVECKEMNVKIDEAVLEQILRYNISLQAKYLVITNGNDCYVFKREKDEFKMIEDFPEIFK